MIHLGDCREVMAAMAPESVDSIVTDPPYGLSFMGKAWDHGVPGVEFWTEALRVAKPGAHLLAFGGTRMFHRLAVAIEDAGWEIRDTVMWVYGQGFPKSLDVSKAIDKAAGVAGTYGEPKSPAHAGWVERGRMRGDQGHEGHQRPWMNDPEAVNRNARQYLAATEAAKQWDGWGTALKPAWEPIIVARKPLIGTVASNVLEHGTGALNIDGCRVDMGNEYDPTKIQRQQKSHGAVQFGSAGLIGRAIATYKSAGRWPANLIHDGSDEVVALFPETGASKAAARGGTNPNPMDWGNARSDGAVVKGHNDNGGSAARFFYCAKASRADRTEGGTVENKHPTVKPTDLMRYLCRLVTPPGGLVLDPFAGSGSTGKAAILEGFRFIGIEQDEASAETARQRLKAAEPEQPSLGL